MSTVTQPTQQIRCPRCGQVSSAVEVAEMFDGMCPQCLAGIATDPTTGVEVEPTDDGDAFDSQKAIERYPELKGLLESSEEYAKSHGAMAASMPPQSPDIRVVDIENGWLHTVATFPHREGESVADVFDRFMAPHRTKWREIRVIRRSPTSPIIDSRIIIVDLWNSFLSPRTSRTVVLFPGDVIFIPRAGWSLDYIQAPDQGWEIILGYLRDGRF